MGVQLTLPLVEESEPAFATGSVFVGRSVKVSVSEDGSDVAPPRAETGRAEMVTQRTHWPWMGLGAALLAFLLVAMNLGWLFLPRRRG